MRETPNTTSLLIEYGFIDNQSDLNRLNNNLIDYVEAAVKAVANYTNTPYTSPNGSKEETYIVEKGDSLYSIAKKFNTTVDELVKINNLSTTTLQVGQILKISKSSSNNGNQETENGIYIVKAGDSLWKISKEFNTTPEEIIKLNNLNTNILQIGQQLLIPGYKTEEEVKPEENIYIVKSGDSLWKIANNYNTTVNELIDLNDLSTTTLQIGQKLKVPKTTNYIEYVVKKGDSLWKIATTYNTTVDKIKTLNNLNTNILQIGQIIRIPK